MNALTATLALAPVPSVSLTSRSCGTSTVFLVSPKFTLARNTSAEKPLTFREPAGRLFV